MISVSFMVRSSSLLPEENSKVTQIYCGLPCNLFIRQKPKSIKAAFIWLTNIPVDYFLLFSRNVLWSMIHESQDYFKLQKATKVLRNIAVNYYFQAFLEINDPHANKVDFSISKTSRTIAPTVVVHNDELRGLGVSENCG